MVAMVIMLVCEEMRLVHMGEESESCVWELMLVGFSVQLCKEKLVQFSLVILAVQPSLGYFLFPWD